MIFKVVNSDSESQSLKLINVDLLSHSNPRTKNETQITAEQLKEKQITEEFNGFQIDLIFKAKLSKVSTKIHRLI